MVRLNLDGGKFQLIRSQTGAVANDPNPPTVLLEDWAQLFDAHGAKSLIFYYAHSTNLGVISLRLWVRDGVNDRYIIVEEAAAVVPLIVTRMHTRAASPLYLQVYNQATLGLNLRIWAYASEEW